MAGVGAKGKSYTPKYRREAAWLVIHTGRTIAVMARELGVGEQVLGGGWPLSGLEWMTRRWRWMSMSAELERLRCRLLEAPPDKSDRGEQRDHRVPSSHGHRNPISNRLRI